MYVVVAINQAKLKELAKCLFSSREEKRLDENLLIYHIIFSATKVCRTFKSRFMESLPWRARAKTTGCLKLAKLEWLSLIASPRGVSATKYIFQAFLETLIPLAFQYAKLMTKKHSLMAAVAFPRDLLKQLVVSELALRYSMPCLLAELRYTMPPSQGTHGGAFVVEMLMFISTLGRWVLRFPLLLLSSKPCYSTPLYRLHFRG